MSKVKLLLDVVEDLHSLADSVQAVANTMLRNEEPDAPAEPKPQENPKPTAVPKKEITLEQVRAVLAELSHDGLTAEVRELLQKYGAQKLSGVDQKHYASLLKDAEGLKNAT